MAAILRAGVIPPVLVELDAQHVGGLRGNDRMGIMDRLAGFVRHQRNAGRGAADRCHSRKVLPLHRLFEVVDTMLLQSVQGLQRLGNAPSRIGIHADRDVFA